MCVPSRWEASHKVSLLSEGCDFGTTCEVLCSDSSEYWDAVACSLIDGVKTS
jgi:hypothetical protein